jgi:ribosomal protein S18 acetylase RimI-like enzyme
MDIRITRAAEKDVAALLGLIKEFARFEDLSEFCEVTEDRLAAAMFGPGAFVDGLMAFDGERAVAYALFYPCFATFRGQPGLYLEDIYITEEYRRHNLGEKMLREIAREAKSRGAVRIDFMVLDWNAAAISFYEKHGAVRDNEERHFKFTDEAFKRLASG